MEQVADPLPPNAEEDQLHKYARCYILALLGDTIFIDKSGDRVHLMWVQQLDDLRNPQRYNWGSACLAWLYQELCRASNKETSQIGGCLLLVQYWAWVRFPYLCPAVKRGPLVSAYGPPQHEYFDWFRRVTRRFIDVPSARLILMVTSPCLLQFAIFPKMKPLFREHDICGLMSA